MPAALMTLTERARTAARRTLSAPSLFSALLRLTPAQNDVAAVQFGFHQLVQPRWRGSRLRCCWIDVSANGADVTVGPAGEFGAAQMAQLVAADVGFPPPPLHLTAGGLELPDVLAAAGAGDQSITRLDVSLCLYASQLSWRAIAERTDGVRTLIVSALDGSTLHDHFDRLVDGDEARQ